jgi:hypothetical protein
MLPVFLFFSPSVFERGISGESVSQFIFSYHRPAGRVAVASSVHGRVQRRQQTRWSAQDQAVAPPLPAQPSPAQATRASMDDRLGQLKQLGELRDAGILTDAEFEAKKALILQS